MKYLLLLVAILYLAGCASQYSISEQQVEHYLNDKLAKQYQLKEGSSALSMGLRSMSVTLGDKPGVMAVTARAEVKLATPIIPLRAELQATFAAKPMYDRSSHSIFLKDLQLLQLTSTPAKLQQLLSGVTPQLVEMTRTLLENQPVYVLDSHNSTQAKLAKITQDIKVEKGKLVLQFE
ncbi:DUF1439 domain-containing protein [Shewanella dokdonensis]|uniref:DUF1439 domain-containing protein n=1 Tax=Shewanella dokdonensis TaxID=712036 RepID=A0ABX8DBE0_9GAMM|nr:DUF1439 domain-containing protein [Shewanella dokdonensis]MCL1076419.1 DUF1439 domain-containing protein [Shewanella dokdonensis]QVK21913.1 DUF1439 domain-containing protein [Shewanella dokdonensis]